MSTLTSPLTRRVTHNLARLAITSIAAAGLSLALPHADATAAGGRTFYLSPAGSDANNGTDAAHPFKSLERVSDGFLQPGDTVLLQRGATFSGKLGLWASGTSSQRITVASYGAASTPKPVITGDCVWAGASYITMQDFTVSNCNTDGIWSDGTDNVITGVEASHNIQGIEIGEHAKNNKVLRNYLHNNDKMWPNTPGEFDDSGAVGMVVVGDNTEVAYNTISDNIAPSVDFGTDGSAVEIYGGIGTLVHHNVATNNRTFTELGNPRSANTTYAYNQVTSNLEESEFLITRGAEDYFGPVAGTVAVNNSVKLTGAKSTGFVCYAGCTTSMFTMYNNVLDVAGRIGNLEGSMSGGNNVYWRGSMYSIHLMPGDRYLDPQFMGRRLVPTPRSPLVDSGRPGGMKTDLGGRKVGVDGNGDGKRGTDIGAYEAKSKNKKAKGGRHHGGKGGKGHHHGGKGHHHNGGQHNHARLS
jgi:Right handed beta helix region